jgi:DNA modification methylase
MWAFNTLTVIDYIFRKVDYEVLKKIIEVCSNPIREQINRKNSDEELLQSSFLNNNFLSRIRKRITVVTELLLFDSSRAEKCTEMRVFESLDLRKIEDHF